MDYEALKSCTLCPRGCKIDRTKNEKGVCGMGSQIVLSRAALHEWEENCISGTKGSGAVFFTGCNMRCIFCQNHRIAAGEDGIPVTEERLGEIFLELQAKGAHNINLVTPTHFVPQIVNALKIAKACGLNIPVVYNTSGYECVETLRMLDGYVDIYLPDFKYMDAVLAKEYSMALDYPEAAKAAIREMVRQTGPCVFEEMEHQTGVCNLEQMEHQTGGCNLEQMERRTGGCNLEQMESQTGVCNLEQMEHQTGVCNLEQMESQTGACDSELKLIKKGTIVRHLVLPGQVKNSKSVLKYLYETYGNNIYYSIMSQYTPMPHMSEHPLLGRTITKREYNKVLDYALELGIENGFIQAGTVAKESFIPAFDGTGVIKWEK